MICHSTVIGVMLIIFVGAYALLTEEGRIIVDDILASCYSDCPHNFAHLAMKPMQMISKIMEWLFGNDTEFPVYVNTARDLAKFILPEKQFK